MKRTKHTCETIFTGLLQSQNPQIYTRGNFQG